MGGKGGEVGDERRVMKAMRPEVIEHRDDGEAALFVAARATSRAAARAAETVRWRMGQSDTGGDKYGGGEHAAGLIEKTVSLKGHIPARLVGDVR